MLDRFHRTLLPPDELRRRAKLYENRLERERSAASPHWNGIAFLCSNLADIYRELDDYTQVGKFQDQAIEAYAKVIAALGETGERGNWAATQHNLANAYLYRIRGERADNLEEAIRHCELALQVYTREAFPTDWAMTQNNLATAYSDRIRGERADNL